MILDGWGIGNGMESDVIASTPTPNINKIKRESINSYLYTCGENVGLPDGQMGNSEVGHLNIGSGRIVYQDLVRINNDIKNGDFFNKQILLNAFSYAKEHNSNVHLLGLVSDGGVHSLETHLFALIDLSDKLNCEKTFVHAITDGRDTDPKSSYHFIELLENKLSKSNVKLASLVGRYYTMDRDKRWERIKEGYDLMVNGIGEHSQCILKSIEKSYKNGITDEFIKPIVMVDDNDKELVKITENDVVICFNFRTDRLRQITIALTQENLPSNGMKKIALQYYTMTRYDEKFINVHPIYEKDNLYNTIGEIISKEGLNQLRIAETEKYAHVTFFFSGGRETPFDNEERILVPSPKVATYDLQPEMSAYIVKDKLIEEIKKNRFDFIVVNFANGDMVGHTGNYSAIKKAVEIVDNCVGEVVSVCKDNYDVIIIADHGNADYALNPDNTPNTAHSLNPVPIIIISEQYKHIKNGILADIAPTILKLLGIKQPKEMTGNSLVY